MLYPLSYGVYLQHALLLLLPPFLTLSLLIRVPGPAVTPPGLRQHRDRHLIDSNVHKHTSMQKKSTHGTSILMHTKRSSHNQFSQTQSLTQPRIGDGNGSHETHESTNVHTHSPQEKKKGRKRDK